MFYEVAPTTWSSSPSFIQTAAWCSNTNTLLGGASTLTGTGAMDGAAKTTWMLGLCTSGAANLADSYSVTINGVAYGDWFLPSKGELNQMYINRDEIGGYVPLASYWSSSEADVNNAWYQGFGSGLQASTVKMATLYVRPVRAF